LVDASSTLLDASTMGEEAFSALLDAIPTLSEALDGLEEAFLLLRRAWAYDFIVSAEMV
jgi:hypothetical protein